MNRNVHSSTAYSDTAFRAVSVAKAPLTLALLAALGTASLFLTAPSPAQAQNAGGKATCSTMDQNGRPLPQPNIGFICGQVEAMRQDCEKGATSPFLMGHCFGFPARDVTATGSVGGTRSQATTSGGGH